jgi:hypothetical protein
MKEGRGAAYFNSPGIGAHIMDESGQISRQQFIESMREQFEHTMGQVAEAVNTAADGAWIDASEHAVRNAFAEFRQTAYSQALQMRIEATESSFSPSEEPEERKTARK